MLNAGTKLPAAGSLSTRTGRGPTMDTTTLIIIIVIVLLLGGGGWYGRGRWF
jgi:hypothetical protein